MSTRREIFVRTEVFIELKNVPSKLLSELTENNFEFTEAAQEKESQRFSCKVLLKVPGCSVEDTIDELKRFKKVIKIYELNP
jgi:hypothetical protein